MPTSTTRPVLIYDGDCGFCCKWIDRWKQTTGDAVDYMPSEKAAALYPDIPATEFDRSVQLVLPDGTRRSGAAAVLEITAPHQPLARLALAAHTHFTPFRAASEAAYAFVASRRRLFSLATACLWGRSATRPTYALSNTLFLRALALVFLIAFLSFAVQSEGLIGSRGILPFPQLLENVAAQTSSDRFLLVPTLLWLFPSDTALRTLEILGIAASLIALAGILQPLCFFILWATMLSLVSVGQDFYNFQWDALLLECGFLAVFLSPWSLRPRWLSPDPPRLARFVAVALLFRLMFCSGVLKLVSGDPHWADLSALEFHFFTQPLPSPAAWFAHHAPPDLLRAACAGMFVIELLLPFAFFLPRVPRTAAALATIALQAGILLTGNYAYFNLLTAALCLLLLDDTFWKSNARPAGIFVTAWIRRPVCSLLLTLSIVPLLLAWRYIPAPLAPLSQAYSLASPLRTVNSYGLFAVMTTTRRELTIEGSADGIHWKPYTLRWKPGPPDRPLPLVAPHQPRLDWQLWFAALGRIETTPWLQALLLNLLEGNPHVLTLFESNPFPDSPPKRIRILADTYTFSDPIDRERTGAIWKSEPAAIHCPPVGLKND
jgi:predicted DCC family thiol-disulfide oxidoreductase YuxK